MLKNIIFFLFIISSVNIFAQKGARIGYIDMNIILNNIEEYQKSTKSLDKNILLWKKEIELKKIQLKNFQNQLEIEKILLTSELIKDKELEIEDFALELINLQEKRFGSNGDMVKQRIKLLQPIQDQVLNIIKDIAKEKKYDFIFDRSSDGTMLYSVKNYDISDLVLKRINRNKKIQDRKEKIEALKSKGNN
ncbi:MAG: OmpH family outer membrane protein [Flavobacteriaceae bacterium]